MEPVAFGRDGGKPVQVKMVISMPLPDDFFLQIHLIDIGASLMLDASTLAR